MGCTDTGWPTWRSDTLNLLGLVLVCGALLWGGAARAQWLLADRQDDTIKADFSTSAVLNPDLVDAVTFFRHELYLQGGARGWGGFWGGYLTVPFGSVIGYGDGTGVDAVGLGNLEVGPIWQIDLSVMQIAVHLGILPPTAVNDLDDNQDTNAELALAQSQFARVTDFLLSVPDAVTLRPAAGVQVPMGLLFLRLDVGADVQIPLDRDTADNDITSYLRANVGVGVQYKLFGFTAEYTTATLINEGQVDFGGDLFLHAVGLSLRLRTKYVQGYVGWSMPLSAAVRGNYYSVTIGLTTRWFIDDDRNITPEEPWP